MLHDEYIKNFLEIPVVIGISLCQSKLIASSYFKKEFDERLNKKELTINIKNIISDLPKDLDFFEFSIKDFYGYIYRLDEIYRILIIVVHDNNVVKTFRAKQLCNKLQEDIHQTIKIFNDLSEQSIPNKQFIQENILFDDSRKNKLTYEYISKETYDEPDLDLILAALNYLSQFVCSFLGPKITSNFWNISRPEYEWLSKFEIKYSSSIVFIGDSSQKINPISILHIREWTRKFMNQCCQVIRDLPERLEKEKIDDSYRKIISIYTSEYLQDMNNFSGDSSESLFGDTLP